MEEYFDCPGCANTFSTKFQVLDHVPKCVYYCAGVNYVMSLRKKTETNVADTNENNAQEIIDDVNDEDLE